MNLIILIPDVPLDAQNWVERDDVGILMNMQQINKVVERGVVLAVSLHHQVGLLGT